MFPVMPVLVNGSSFITMKASDVLALSHNAIAGITNHRVSHVASVLKECMEEECVHRIPLLGIPFFRHKRYPTTDIAMEHAPEIRRAKQDGWGDLHVCESLREMALWLINESGYPEEKQVMQISLNDFKALK